MTFKGILLLRRKITGQFINHHDEGSLEKRSLEIVAMEDEMNESRVDSS